MPILAGTRVGPYEIVGLLGAGGMGEVYRARDTKLARDVALKILPESFVSNADRVSRFQREAQVLASLNHPNIAAIYGLEESPAEAGHYVRALVLELVEGPTLADRLALGPLALDEALSIARQIAEALEAAHAHGVIHRDLKPANVKVRPDGLVKVLDFGLAKLSQDSGPGAQASALDPTVSPTMTSPAMTRMGLIMGTAAYMSPEQARGSLVDSRTDVWSFGVVLYEMLAGRTLFEGPTVSDTLAAVLRADLDWDRLPSDLPPDVRRLLRRCLQRDAKKRFQHIGDARVEIEDLQTGPIRESPETPAGRRWGLAVAAALLTALVVAPAVWTLKPSAAAGVPATSLVVRTPSEAPVGRGSPLALSPDGRQLVYTVGLGSDALGNRLIHQSLNVFDPRSLEGTDASGPFLSPDGNSVGFFSQSSSQLQQLRLTGGGATGLVNPASSLGASWGDNETIVFVEEWGQPLRVRHLDTSETRDLTRLNVSAGERAHIWPQLLPGNRAVLFTVWTAALTWDESLLAVADFETGMHRIVLRGGTFGRYSSSGHLVFWRGDALMAVPFDLSQLAVTGDAAKVVSGVRLDNSNGAAHFALSSTGTLAYVAGGVDTFAEAFVADRSGRQVARLDEMVAAGDPVFSPDGKRVALTLYNGGTFGVGVFDLERRVLTRLPLAGDNALPAWTRKGDRVTFVSNASSAYNHYSMPFDGSSAPEALFPPEAVQAFVPSRSTWSPNERHFVYGKPGGKTGVDIWIHTPGQKSTPKPLIATGATESNPAISPDGRFIAYQSDESDSVEVYVRPFPNVDAGRELISRSGGTLPTWSRDGTEIFYLSDKGIMRVPVTSNRGVAARLSFGQPSVTLAMSGLSGFDVSPDGRTFAIQRVPVEKGVKEIRVVVNWFEELKRLVPTR